MNVKYLSSTSLSRRFAVAAAILTATAVLLTSLASFWLVDQQRSAAARLLQQREVVFHAETVSNTLQAIAQRLSDVASSPILATALVDSAGKETYLTPFLHGFRQVNGIPIQLVFTDFQGKEITGNGIAKFDEREMAWLREQIDRGSEAAIIRDGVEGPELLGTMLLRYARTKTPEGALMYKILLSDLRPAPSARLAWGERKEPVDKFAIMPINAPASFAHLGLRVDEDLRVMSQLLGNLDPQYTMIIGMALGLAAIVFLLGSRLALNLTRDVRELEAFASNLGNEGISTQRAELSGSVEVINLARSINRMLDRMYQQHAQLQSESEKFYQLANTIPQLAWIADPDGSITWYNDRWYAYTGTTPEQMKGWGWRTVHDPNVLPQVIQQWKESLISGRMMQMTFPIRGADGQFRHFFTSVAPLRDATGRIAQWFGTNTDVSLIEEAERAVRRSEERLQQGLVAARMAVWDWSLANERIGFSANLQSVFGESWETMDQAWQLVHPADLVQLKQAVEEAIQSQGDYHSVARIRRADDGRMVWVEMRGKIGTDAAGEPYAVHAIAMDVTERKRAEEALQMADRRKDEFLAMLAHELRNPLAPISTAAQLLSLLYVSEPRVKQTSEIITRQVRHMTRLVDELLDVSRVTRGLVTIHRLTIDLRNVVSEAVDQTTPLMEAKGHHLIVELPEQPAWVDGDQTRLVQVVTNLLNNSAKYTSEAGHIIIEMELLDDDIVLRVRDNGAGITSELLPEVFELFTQGKRTLDRSQGGLGLGLALVKKMVELHGGSVIAHSGGIGKGSEFTIRLPRKKEVAQPEPISHETTEPVTNHTLHIMVVDDNVDAANSMAMLLQAEGYSVSVEYTAHAALKRAVAEAPDVMLLDIGLPDMEGYELARRLKMLPRTAQSVLIAVTGYGQAQDQAKSHAAGFAEHLVKPVSASRLSAIMAQLKTQAARLHA